MKIIDSKLKFKSLTPRKKTEYIILHHRAGNGDILSIHQEHLKQGWAGCGYTFYVMKDGSVYQGRPINMFCAACPDFNSISINICFEGNYDREKIMPLVQFEAGKEVIKYCQNAYKNTKTVGHMEKFATDCPGRFFPLEKFKAV